MKEAIVYVGIDVAKAYLDVAWQEQRQRVPNDAVGRNQLLKRFTADSALPVNLPRSLSLPPCENYCSPSTAR